MIPLNDLTRLITAAGSDEHDIVKALKEAGCLSEKALSELDEVAAAIRATLVKYSQDRAEQEIMFHAPCNNVQEVLRENRWLSKLGCDLCYPKRRIPPLESLLYFVLSGGKRWSNQVEEERDKYFRDGPAGKYWK
jgi:hypothetical protein